MTFEPHIEEKLRHYFKYLNVFMIWMWRLGLGWMLNIWPDVFGRIMVITHTGRKSGHRYQTPVNYTIIDGDIYCTAGFGADADWFRNLIADPQVEIWLPDGWWWGVAEDISDCDGRLPILREVLIASGFAAYLAGINPRKMDHQTLSTLTAPYRLIRIQRAEARTGANGPGDLAWIWPLATLLLLPLIFPRRKRK
ncbi:MAG: nitroreductase family deazaflavin-dependent oxidoreductase [Chloroflexota bacterium]